jgi:hypothetical protein
MKRKKVIWRGHRPPTRAEQRVIANGLANGTIPNGAELRLSNTRDAARAYERFHWGKKAKRAVKTRLPAFDRIYELGKLRKVEYETTKGRENAIWVHSFHRPYPVLTATPDGKLGPIVGGVAHVTERGIER